MASNGNRKHGRGRDRPANKRYTAERRWEANAKRRRVRYLKRCAKQRDKALRREQRKREAAMRLLDSLSRQLQPL